MEYYWADCSSNSGATNTFTEITNYNDARGCGYISSGASVSITKCGAGVSEGFICEHTSGKNTVKLLIENKIKDIIIK